LRSALAKFLVAAVLSLGLSWSPESVAGDLTSAAVWDRALSPTSRDLFAVAASPDGSFVAVGAAGTVVASPDGVAWSAVPPLIDTDLLAVAANAGGWLAAGDGGIVLASANGRTWVARTSGSAARLSGLAWNGSLWVAVGSGGSATEVTGAILSSSDGVRWFDDAPGGLPPLLDVAWDGRQFVAVGWTGGLATSPDGAEWSVGSLGGNLQQCWFMLRPSYVYSVAAGGSRLAAVGLVVGDQYPGLGVALASSDGIAWSCSQTEVAPDYFRFRAVTWAGDRFVAVGLGGGIGESRDGLAWTRQVSPATPTLRGIAVGRSRLVAVGEGGVILTRACVPPSRIRRRLPRID
jgi:hypothetical protein